MPRRAAPTALHLSSGPMPGRGEPRHTLPAPPQPVFHSKSVTKPRSDSTSSLSRRKLSGADLPLLGFSGSETTDRSNVDGVMFEPMHSRGFVPQWDARPGSLLSGKRQPGPWDRTRSNTLPQEQIAELVAVPKPVVANPAPLW